jgi:hypothetical protein
VGRTAARDGNHDLRRFSLKAANQLAYRLSQDFRLPPNRFWCLVNFGRHAAGARLSHVHLYSTSPLASVAFCTMFKRERSKAETASRAL